ncbi:uncharacterized protein LOC142639889 [Castanea sativa]|uniref:uncharacterized protein LOC142639889 n=1 Tax=Castanea sativa TaxID=21020 RepID=UPI003F651A2F
MFNEIDGDFDDVAIRTFKVNLPAEHGLRKSLTGKPVSSVRQLMDWIDKYKRVDKDQQLGKGKKKWQIMAAIVPQAVNMVFQEPVHQILEKIKNGPYFKWPNKMSGDPTRCNHNLHCQYHQERGHTTENCRNLWYHLEQLVRDGRLKQFLYRHNGQVDHTNSGTQGNTSSRPPLGTINVIFVTPGRTGSCPSHVMTVARLLPENSNHEPKRAKVAIQLALSFSKKDKFGTIQPHDDTLVVKFRIRGYDVRHVMVDQGSGAKIMYPNLYKGLKLKPEDLTSYDSPLVGFDGKMVIPMGQVKLLVQTG